MTDESALIRIPLSAFVVSANKEMMIAMWVLSLLAEQANDTHLAKIIEHVHEVVISALVEAGYDQEMIMRECDAAMHIGKEIISRAIIIADMMRQDASFQA
ncbi:MAG: hypothetical protein C4321_00345 [Chloroflexota bacterium]